MKHIKRDNVFIYYTTHKFSTTLSFVSPDIFWKIDLKAFFFSTVYE